MTPRTVLGITIRACDPALRHCRKFCRPFVLALLAACAGSTAHARQAATGQAAADVARARRSITADKLLRHIAVLASDGFEGRGAGTRGDSLSVGYLVDQFQRAGLAPGNPDGSYLQAVPLARVSVRGTARYTFPAHQPLELQTPRDWVVRFRRPRPDTTIADSPVVFVGYGVVAPAFGWDDYKGADVRGRTVLMLYGDPPVPDPQDPSRLDPTMFDGPRLSPYGNPNAKVEVAARRGAAAVLIIHDSSAGFPYSGVASAYGRELIEAGEPLDSVSTTVSAYIRRARADELTAASGEDLDSLRTRALRRSFTPVPLDATAAYSISYRVRRFFSHNVVAKLDGSDPLLKREYLIYTAHWDHLGRDTTLSGDQIYNGAVDDAGGVAQLLEIGRAFRALSRSPRRSILFMATTAEEAGLLGATFYTAHPLYPLDCTLADINLDWFIPWGRSRRVTIHGAGNTTLDEVLEAALRDQGRMLAPDTAAEQHYFERSDQYPFAAAGVPSLYPAPGLDFIGRPAGYGRRVTEAYDTHDYHQVSDEIRPDWDLSGAVQDARLYFDVGYRVIQAEGYPAWKPTTAFPEFKARRDSMLAGRRTE